MSAGERAVAALLAAVLAGPPGSAGAQAPDADSLFAAGRLVEARDAYARVVAADPSDARSLGRLGILELWSNRLTEAELHLTRALDAAPDDREITDALAESLYRRGRFTEAAPLYERLGRAAMAAKAAALTEPYRVTIPDGGVRLDFAPGAVLPVIPVEVNGVRGDFILDTGAGETIVDVDFAARAGVRLFGRDSATYAGGATAGFEHAAADSLGLGEALVRDVPVHVQSTAAFAPAAGGRAVAGIIGTSLLARFRSTIDFGGRALVLEPAASDVTTPPSDAPAPPSDAPPPPSGATPLPPGAVAIPFWLLGDHFVTVAGTVAGIGTLLVFDTGLAMPGGALVPAASLLEEAGVEPEGQSFTGLGGGGAVTVTPFTLERPVEVAGLRRDGVVALAGAFPPVLERRFGPRIGGLISHGFFEGRAVTLDFRGMRLVVRDGGEATVAEVGASPGGVGGEGPAAGPGDVAGGGEAGAGVDGPAAGARLDPAELAAEVVRLLRAGRSADLEPLWSEALLERLPPASLGTAWDGLVASLGEPTEVLPAESGTDASGAVFGKVPVRFRGVVIAVTVLVDDEGRVRGVAMQPG